MRSIHDYNHAYIGLCNYIAVQVYVSLSKLALCAFDGRTRYVVRNITVEIEFEKVQARLCYMCELNRGRSSVDVAGWGLADEACARFIRRS